MTDFATMTVIKAFLASPSDLGEERRIAKQVVDEVNRSVGRTWGIIIDLLGWEDTLPGAGRPQDLINKDVDECDLFIGMLWRRWGQPTGSHSSGFEEEFERALTRRLIASSPEIWLAFKRVEPEQLEDAGEQLRKVQAFRDARRAARELLYKEFGDSSDWERQLREWLNTYVSEQAKHSLTASPTPTSSGAASSASQPGVLQATQEPSEPIPAQAAELGSKIANVLSQPNLDSYIESVAQLDETDLARLLIFAKALFTFFVTHEVLTVHEVNLLYRLRQQLDLVTPERLLLFRTLVADTDNVCPGWFWFTDLPIEEVTSRLVGLARNDSDAGVRESALTMLTQGRLYPIKYSEVESIRLLLRDQTISVQIKALEYAGELGGVNLVEELDDIIRTASSVAANRAANAKISILIRTNPTLGFEAAAKEAGGVSGQVIGLLREKVGGVSSQSLRSTLSHQEPQLRQLSAFELLNRRELTESDARTLLGDSSLAVRQVACMALIQIGQPLTPEEVYERLKPTGRPTGLLGSLKIPYDEPVADPEEVVSQTYRTFPQSQLESEIDWFSVRGPIAYRIMGERFFSDKRVQIRGDLLDGFTRIRDESAARLRSKFGDRVEDFLSQSADIESLVRTGFIAAGLFVLAEHGGASDVELARMYLPKSRKVGEDEQALQSIRLLERFGSNDDVSGLLQLATVAFGEVKQRAAEVALHLTASAFETANRLLETSDPLLIKVSVNRLLEEQSNRGDALLAPYLHSDNQLIRARAVNYYVRRNSADNLVSLVKTYLESGSYYYNVVSWIDRALYSPEPLRTAYRNLLKQS